MCSSFTIKVSRHLFAFSGTVLGGKGEGMAWMASHPSFRESKHKKMKDIMAVIWQTLWTGTKL